MQNTLRWSLVSALAFALWSPALSLAEQTAPRASIKDVSWIEGTWVSTSGARTVEERWTPPAGGTMFAVSRTVTG